MWKIRGERFKHTRKIIPVSMRREYLIETGVLSKTLGEKAERVSEARNNAAHLRLDVLPPAEEVLQDLADVLNGLSPPEFNNGDADLWSGEM